MREVLGVLILIIGIWLHFKYVSKTAIKTFYVPAVLIKLIAGIVVGVIYTYYYSVGDTWNYFNQAVIFSEVGFSNFSNFTKLFIQNKYELVAGFNYINQPRAALMVKIVAIVNVLSGSNYWVTSLFFSFFSFIGVYKFAAWVHTKFKYGKTAALALFIWPSFIIWSSGILKETIAVGLIFYIIPTFFEATESKSIKKTLLVIIGFYLLFLIKYYFASVLIVSLTLYVISMLINLQSKAVFYQIIIWVSMLLIGFVFGGQLHYNLRLANIIEVIIANNQAFGEISKTQSLINYSGAVQPWVWLLINAPKALFASLFMPLIPVGRVFFILASIENWILLGLLARGLALLKITEIKKHSILLLASLTYIFTLAVFLALSTPNLGTLSRYKVSFIPIFLVIILLSNRFSYKDDAKCLFRNKLYI